MDFMFTEVIFFVVRITRQGHIKNRHSENYKNGPKVATFCIPKNIQFFAKDAEAFCVTTIYRVPFRTSQGKPMIHRSKYKAVCYEIFPFQEAKYGKCVC